MIYKLLFLLSFFCICEPLYASEIEPAVSQTQTQSTGSRTLIKKLFPEEDDLNSKFNSSISSSCFSVSLKIRSLSQWENSLEDGQKEYLKSLILSVQNKNNRFYFLASNYFQEFAKWFVELKREDHREHICTSIRSLVNDENQGAYQLFFENIGCFFQEDRDVDPDDLLETLCFVNVLGSEFIKIPHFENLQEFNQALKNLTQGNL